MKHIVLLLTFTLSMFSASQIYAQDGMDKIRSAMVSLYTERMDLTTEQAKLFWPLHEEYETERRKINQEIRRIKQKGDPTELKKLDALEEQRFELRTKFKSRFLNVISTSQLSKMYSAEEEFRKMLIDRKNRD